MYLFAVVCVCVHFNENYEQPNNEPKWLFVCIYMLLLLQIETQAENKMGNMQKQQTAAKKINRYINSSHLVEKRAIHLHL